MFWPNETYYDWNTVIQMSIRLPRAWLVTKLTINLTKPLPIQADCMQQDNEEIASYVALRTQCTDNATYLQLKANKYCSICALVTNDDLLRQISNNFYDHRSLKNWEKYGRIVGCCKRLVGDIFSQFKPHWRVVMYQLYACHQAEQNWQFGSFQFSLFTCKQST